jgi:membrane-associated phospholipid phosphatase
MAIAAAIAVPGGRCGRRPRCRWGCRDRHGLGCAILGVNHCPAVRVLICAYATRRGPRHVQARLSTSFPSGHAASAFAFANAVGRHLPVLAMPIRLLAGTVAGSRVRTGVHYPGDLVIGSILGAAAAAMNVGHRTAPTHPAVVAGA